jgi:anti-anti-sigma regulatory factor
MSLAPILPLCGQMLKITVEERRRTKTIRLEGRVVGAWVDELRQLWQRQARSLARKKILVDLCGVTHMSADGIKILADMHRTNGAQFVTNTPMTQYFAEQAKQLGSPKIKISKEN